ncbi:uncharacterized protein TRAVEDRAFT_45178 [Trametes versicolor FP-101664 SS1]|uniref:uncharacterized protein n=1 Tax=Trametes versicolor (strain FP-101664) TaxID=717944 RepID=UPI0004621792|nr:uncharacterized protein TRAVEDRAFT_45178 [Trametes versicolor FP-101664 SS1]EIW62357.1 hypothetical protein TRAVEDRAFT_45178 [Trametes versicolor FP-101664 SS1]
MNVSDAATICRLMQSSRELYHHGPKLLIPSLLFLQRDSHLESFMAFLAAEAPYRFKFVKRIYITISYPSLRVAALLAVFLVRFGPVLQLQLLGLEDAESFLGVHPALADAFANLEKVERFEMGDVGPATTAMLEHSKSALNEVTLLLDRPPTEVHAPEGEQGVHDVEGGGEEEDQGDEEISELCCSPIFFLHKSRDTLRSLCVSRPITTPFHVLSTIQYPRLTTLHLGNNEVPRTYYYAHAFPNLSTLTVCTAKDTLAGLVQSEEAMLDHHNLNVALQVEHGTWTTLESASGMLIDFVLLALTCPPAYLHLDFFDVGLFAPGIFAQAMSGPTVASLRSLETSLVLGMALDRDKIDMAHALVSLTFTLTRSCAGLPFCPSAPKFCLTIGCAVLALLDMTKGGVDPRDPYFAIKQHIILFTPRQPCAAEKYIAALDLDALARRMQAAGSDLETVVITLQGHRSRADARVVVGAVTALARGEDAVEVIPLRAPGAVKSPFWSWSKGAVVLKEKREAEQLRSLDRARDSG